MPTYLVVQNTQGQTAGSYKQGGAANRHWAVALCLKRLLAIGSVRQTLGVTPVVVLPNPNQIALFINGISGSIRVPKGANNSEGVEKVGGTWPPLQGFRVDKQKDVYLTLKAKTSPVACIALENQFGTGQSTGGSFGGAAFPADIWIPISYVLEALHRGVVQGRRVLVYEDNDGQLGGTMWNIPCDPDFTPVQAGA
jgi:hypothetical protein